MRSFSVISGENALAQQFINLRRDAAGGANLLVHQQLGAFTLSTNPTNTKTLTLDINGTNVVFTFVTAIGATAGNVLIGASAAATCANLLALLNQPQTTTTTGVALSTANQLLVSYLSYALSGTTLTVSSNSNALYAPLTSFSASTTATSDSWTGQTMQLYVEPGVVYVNGTRVIFAGGSTPTVTAPSSHPRIDVLTIDSSGTLAWTTGTENASPNAPTYPADKIALCELWNVVGETQLLDNDNQTSGQGFVYNDVRPVLGLPFNPAAIIDTLLPAVDATYNLGSPSFEWNNIYAKSGVFVNGAGVAIAKFGGTGADGALSITSGTTTVSASSATLLLKNYTSISITSTGTLAFSTPATNGTLIILRSQANVTLTSSSAPMIDASGMGAAGGTAATGTNNGNAGTTGLIGLLISNAGGAGTNSAGGTGGAISSLLNALASPAFTDISTLPYWFHIFAGGGGGSGNAATHSGSTQTSGAGGNGGGALVIECGGSWNFTTANGISVAGKAGGNAVLNSGSGDAGAGAGGAAGSFIGLYNALTANSGTVNASGGSPGTTAWSGFANSSGGGAGANIIGAGGSGTSIGPSPGGVGGTGANGKSIVAQNTLFA